MDIADDVERSMLLFEVIPHRASRNRRGINLLGRAQHMNCAEAFAFQCAHGAAQLLDLSTDHLRAKIPIVPVPVARLAHPFRQVEDDRHRQHVLRAGQFHQRFSGLGLYAGSVYDGESTRSQPLGGDVVQHIEGVLGRLLTILIVRDKTTAIIRREHLGRLEMLAGKRRFARARSADENHA